jgi:hypothetical protein
VEGCVARFGIRNFGIAHPDFGYAELQVKPGPLLGVPAVDDRRLFLRRNCVAVPETEIASMTRAASVRGRSMRDKAQTTSRANQSLEPTTTAVTISAAQKVAPAAVVAHL